MLLTVGCAVVQVDPSQSGAKKDVRKDTSPTLGLAVFFFVFLRLQKGSSRKSLSGAGPCGVFFWFFLAFFGCVEYLFGARP
jgi:hypothetical protein